MSYMSFIAGKPVEVRCKSCKAVIAEAPKGKPGELNELPNYALLVLAMHEANDSLGKHVTPLCVDCRKRILDQPALGELESLYNEDLAQWIENAIRAGETADKAAERAVKLSRRRPIRALDIDGRRV
jgi:hypothetical protein